MCIIAIKPREVKYPSFQRVQAMCDNNSDGFAIVWQANQEPVRNYRTLDKSKFLNKYKELTTMYNDNDISLFIHARIKTHGTQKLENCHGWIDNKVGLAFAHNGILSIKNRGDMTDSETFFRDIFSPVFEIGGWDAAELAIKAIIGTSKFCFMDMYGNLIHYGEYITGDDGVLYSNYSYIEYAKPYRTCYNFHGTSYKPVSKVDKKSTCIDTTDYDDWFNRYEYWD